MSSIAVGIDLGTTNSCVACYINDRVRILEIADGGRTTPSYVYMKEQDTTIVGHFAKKLADLKPEYGIYEIKRLVGRKFDDPHVQTNIGYFPFTVVGVKNDPVIAIKRKNDVFTATPELLCTAILNKMKADAEAKLGKPIDKAVITVPAYFNNSQRMATLSAAKEAGFTVLKLLNEPTAAALSYYLEQDEEENYSLVYDLGGGTFDVAILKRSGTNLEIIAVDGNAHLGGNDFDNLIMDYACDYLQTNFKYNPKSDRRALRRLRNECEDAKKILSSAEDTIIVLDGLVRDRPLKLDLTRVQFENMAQRYFQDTIDILDNCLKSSKLAKTDIKEVILSGGSTRIPKIQQMLSDYFDGKELNKFVNPDECVAKGAALQAAMLSTNENQRIEVFKITDVTPLSLGIGLLADLMDIYIARNTPIPASVSKIGRTVHHQQMHMKFNVWEGERSNVKKNRHLGTVRIQHLTPAPPGQCNVSLTMSIDENGILQVKAKEEHQHNVKDLTIAYTRGHTSDKEVRNALKDAEYNKAEDERFVKFANLKIFVIDYCEKAKYNFEKKRLKLARKDLYELCEKTKISALKMTMEQEKDLEKLHDEIRKACDEVVAKYEFELMPVFED